MYRELSQYIPPGANTWTSADQLNAIIQGNVAIGMYQGRVFSNLVTMNPSLIGKISNTLVPYNKQPSNFGGYSAHGVLKGGKNPQGAKDMIKFSMTKAEFIEWILVNPGQSNPVITSFGTDPSYIGSNVLKAFDPKLVATMIEAEKGQIDFVKEGPGWKLNVKAGTLSGSLFLADVLQKVIIGKESSQSVATFGAQQIRDIMKG